MSDSSFKGLSAGRRGERGASRLKFLVVVAVIAALAYVAYQYVPVAYHASLYKVFMQDTVDKTAALGKPASWGVDQLRAAAPEYDVPSNAAYNAEARDGRLEISVRWTRPVTLPGYTYNYEFDHTVRSSTFFKQN